MKLQLKHIAAYFLFGLQAEHEDTHETDTIDYINHKKGLIGRCAEYPNDSEDNVICDKVEKYKPLLRSIESINGHVVYEGVEREIFDLMSSEFSIHSSNYKNGVHKARGFIHGVSGTLEDFEMLHKMHIDLYDLISNNLAFEIG